ncbi:hypothetical protein COW81_02810 [Candidatus Campbellbacteria bacterium CG22_combo_CG10-13_8_21_14_all_36_13]|uniref:Uncharacterized protein n=1 Tax=Candidatus Campbellbacteria bacterium CG22_combo_CG10-13_8_21_14_all_36_13 TaxID=1974529 RepID=A0A2H0DXR8_9BACT|nr:MAG: hypothetical protein COW81_02810 [Candidatus Campbellbacteria bacterium CG22_combo_CG10-13_8_21_14_all_36_13]
MITKEESVEDVLWLEPCAIYARFLNRLGVAEMRMRILQKLRSDGFKLVGATPTNLKIGSQVCFRYEPPSCDIFNRRSFFDSRERFNRHTSITRVAMVNHEWKIWLGGVSFPFPIGWFYLVRQIKPTSEI